MHIFLVFLFVKACKEIPPLSFENSHDTQSDSYIPLKPSGLTVGLVNDSLVFIDWHDESKGTEGFIVQRRSQHQANFETIAKLPQEQFVTITISSTYKSKRFYDSTKLKIDTLYYYRVAAFTKNNVSIFTDVGGVRPIMNVPHTVSLSGDSTGITLTWSVSQTFPTKTKIERSENNGTFFEVALLNNNIFLYKDNAVNISSNYSYRLSSVTTNNKTVTTEIISAVYTVLSAPKVHEIQISDFLTDMIIDKNQTMIVTSSALGIVKGLSFPDGNEIFNLQANSSGGSYTLALNESKSLLAVCNGGDVKVYSLPLVTLMYTINAGENVYGMAVSSTQNGPILATINNNINQQLRLWNLETGDSIYTFPQLVTDYRSIYISPDNSRIIAGGDESVSVWDLNTKNLVSTFDEFSFILHPLFKSSSEIYSVQGGIVKELISGVIKNNFTNISSTQNCIAFQPDGDLIAIADYEGSWLYDLKTQIYPVKLHGLSGWNKKIYFTKDGSTIFGANNDGKIFFWKTIWGWKKI